MDTAKLLQAVELERDRLREVLTLEKFREWIQGEIDTVFNYFEGDTPIAAFLRANGFTNPDTSNISINLELSIAVDESKYSPRVIEEIEEIIGSHSVQWIHPYPECPLNAFGQWLPMFMQWVADQGDSNFDGGDCHYFLNHQLPQVTSDEKP